jgi:hypothetical protein
MAIHRLHAITAAVGLRAVVVLAVSASFLATAAPNAAQVAQAAQATTAASAPGASTSGTSDVTFSSVTVHGSVSPHGQATDYVFQYGTTRKYGSQTPLSPAGNASNTVAVSQTVTGLQPFTTYHYRILASSPSGAAVGEDRTFTTAKIPLSVAIVGVPNPVAFGTPFVVEGTLSGTGGGNHEVALQANPFPYVAGFQTVGNPELTNPVGGFSFPFLNLLQNTQLRVVTVGTPVVTSPVIVEGVAVRVAFHAHATGRRGFARLYGTVAPAEVGALVGFQLLQPGHRSRNVGGTVVKAGTPTVSSFSRVVHVGRGVYRALIEVSDGAHVSSYSTPIIIH